MNSSPIVVGKPINRGYERYSWAGASSYQSYREAKATRTQMVYVGANDGMLHGFDAKTGVEKFAFIPSELLSSLRTWRVRNMPTASTWMASCRWPTSISVVPGRAFSSARQGVGHLDVRDRRYRPVVAGRQQHHGSSAMRRWATCFQNRPCCV